MPMGDITLKHILVFHFANCDGFFTFAARLDKTACCGFSRVLAR
jgi:hypothetical protein